MLPGIRFIFVTVILSASVLIFGLGAAALLRVSHEEFATLPSWRVAQPQFPPAPVETTIPTLAMLRIETPEAAKADATEESPDPTPAPSTDADLRAQDTPDNSSVTAEALPQHAAFDAAAEKSADVTGGQPAPAPVESPAPTAVAVAPTTAIEKQENGTTGPAESCSNNSEAVAPGAQENPTTAAETKRNEGETADIKVAEIKSSEHETPETKSSELKSSETDAPEVSVIAAIAPGINGQELRTVKVHATKPKPMVKKKTRSGIYAMAQRRRAVARARAIARARAARIAQQKLVAMDPLAALFGLQTQPAQIDQIPHQ